MTGAAADADIRIIANELAGNLAGCSDIDLCALVFPIEIVASFESLGSKLVLNSIACGVERRMFDNSRDFDRFIGSNRVVQRLQDKW